MTKKKAVVSSKAKSRMFLAFIFFGSIISFLSYKLFNNLILIKEMKEEKIFLEEKIIALKEEEKLLEIDVQKLEDPTYVARYAREKYLYSKDGEIIIRIEE